MPKAPDTVQVKVTISNFKLEVPKSFFEHGALRAAIFVGRQGRSAATRRTKWFTLADPSLVPSNTRKSLALPAHAGERRASTASATDAEAHAEDVMVDVAVMEYSGINNVVYEVEMRPLNVFEGDWVFDQKTTHPVKVFAKILAKARPGVKVPAVKSEQESNLNEMMEMDQDEMESDADSEDRYSSSQHGEEGGLHAELSLSGMGLTAEQLAALSGDGDANEMMIHQLYRGIDCKRRYLQFPRTIDVSTIVNTHAKTMNFCERLQCKNAALMGCTLSFTISAELPLDVLHKYEDKVRSKEEKADVKRREKEEKVLEKEKKKSDKADAKRREKEGLADSRRNSTYGADVTEAQPKSATFAEGGAAPPKPANGAGAPTTPGTPGEDAKKKKGFSPFSAVKSIFSGKEEKPPKTTPFPIKFTTSPYPFLIVLERFELKKLIMAPENYRAVHIRLGIDSVSVDEFPRLLLDATKPNCRRDATVTWYDGKPRDVVRLDFGTSRIIFGDKHLRNITGFDTLRALQEHDKAFHAAQKDALEGSTHSQHRDAESDLFHEQLMNVGVKFHPVSFEPTKYSSNENQTRPSKNTRVTAQLIVANDIVGPVAKSDEEEKVAYIKQLKKEGKAKDKAEKEREEADRKAQKEAEKAAKKPAKEVHAEGADEAAADGAAAASGGADSSSGAGAGAAATSKTDDSPDTGDEKKESESADKFESGAVDHLEATEEAAPTEAAKEKKEKHEKDTARLVMNETNSFQLGTYVLNEDYIPEAGVPYRIVFRTGEELSFRARRVFLPSVCKFGDAGCTREPTIAAFMQRTRTASTS